MTTSETPELNSHSKSVRIISWVLRILAAVAFTAAGVSKLAGTPQMVEMFNQIGAGQWFRILTGTIEVVGGIGILIPATVGLAGILLATTMMFAFMTHLFVIGGNPTPALLLFVITATVAWLYRAHTVRMFKSKSSTIHDNS